MDWSEHFSFPKDPSLVYKYQEWPISDKTPTPCPKNITEFESELLGNITDFISSSIVDTAQLWDKSVHYNTPCKKILFHKRLGLNSKRNSISYMMHSGPRLLAKFVSWRRFRRNRIISILLVIFSLINYKYWTGPVRFPLSCNLLGIGCLVWPISGNVANGYESVMSAFRQNFEDGLEIGASFSAYVNGVPVVELYGGYHAGHFRQHYSKESLQLVFSSSKVLVISLF